LLGQIQDIEIALIHPAARSNTVLGDFFVTSATIRKSAKWKRGIHRYMSHMRLVEDAVRWLRTKYRCGIVLSEQSCSSGEAPDAIGWKARNHSVIVECKISRSDFLADAAKPWRANPACAMGCERYYLAPLAMIKPDELHDGWGLLEVRGREISIAKRSKKNLRSDAGLANEMNLLLASLRRVEVRIEPQTITDFLKWKNRMTKYNGGTLPAGIASEEADVNGYLVMGRSL
jgi:hypothetical protein